ncbi:hypothetical protein CDV55_107446 [Aspergillus turcosus]|nr:hypothetical protein CDV55_107446 [Aspergillus turcosus]
MGSITPSVSEYDVAVSRDEGLGQLFYQRMVEDPSAMAIVNEEGQSLTYEALHERAIELAQALTRNALNVEERVGIVVQHGLWDAVTQVAIIYAGGTCVPLDPLLPDQQIINRLKRLGTRYVLVDEANSKRKLPFTLLPVGELRLEVRKSFHTLPGQFPALTTMAHCTHLIHTSGTTSEPKAVQIAARSIVHVAHHAPYAPVRKSDVVGHGNSTSFDVALFDIWAALVRGAAIGVLSKSTLLDSPAMAAAIRQLGITIMAITAPLVNLAAATCPTTFQPLRVVLMGGEAVNLRAMEAILTAGPPEHLMNAYGPTECCVYCLTHEITMDDVEAGKVGIGKPIGCNVCCVCDEEGRLVTEGEEGELLVGGPGVSPGYVDQPDKNAKTFIYVAGMVDPGTGEPYRMYRTGDMVRLRCDGEHDFLGRRDHQVKVRGYRVELAPVDAALMKTGHFSEGFCMRIDSKEDGAGATLVAFVVLQDNARNDAVADAMKTLRATLPEYMVPHIEVILEMPLNAHAKIDRRKLEEMYRQRREKHLCTLHENARAMSTREHLAHLWATILATPVPEYADDDDFFVLGGTSLQASLLISRIRQQFRTVISLLTLYDHSTLGQLASVIDRHRGTTMATVRNERSLWIADTKLADGLQLPLGPVVDWRRDTEGRVFLTGATGFVGAFFLADLLKMPDVHQVGCLVRAVDTATGLQRLRAALRKYNLWHDTFLPKLLPLCGSLEDHWLGLGEQRFGEIANWASVIFHLGARVNYTQPYSLHRPANILGTLNVARLAVTGRLKGLHYCSSISCYGPTGFVTGAKIIYEDAPLLPHLDALTYDHGYAQSQWAADQLLQRLVGRGFPIAVYRPGFVTGDHRTGACNPDDFFSRFIRASLDLGSYPDLPKQRKEFVPVDYAVTAMLHISSRGYSLGHAFHLLPQRSGSVDMDEVMELLGQTRGAALQRVSYSEWIERLSASAHASLQPLLPMLAEKVHKGLSRWELYENMPTYDDTNTRRALATYPGGLQCPLFDCALMKNLSDDKMLRGKSLRVAQMLLTVVPAFITYGYNQAGLGPLATLQSWVHTFPEIDTINTKGALKAENATKKGAVIASMQLGALVGALSCIAFGDRLGRRKTIFLGAMIVIIGQLLQTSSYGIIQFTLGRVILGLGIGQLSATVPVFQAECSAAKDRGRHVVVDGICMTLGFVLVNWIDFGFSKTSGDMQWRVPLALSFLFPLVILGTVFWLPESPRWLVLVARRDEAAHSLAAYKGLGVDDDAIQMEIASIESSLEITERSGRVTLRELCLGEDEDRLLYRFALCLIIQFFQQMCGGNLISTYISTIYEQNLHLGKDLSRILAASALTWKTLCNFIPYYTVDRLGRRKLFMFSGTGMSLCMIVLAITTSFSAGDKRLSIASAAVIWMFNFFYPIGFSGANFVYCTEVAPVQLRVAMASASIANKWLWNFVVVMMTPVALDTIGYRYYIVFAAISASIPVTVYFFYPETMGRNLEAMNQVFRDAPSVWRIVATAKKLPQGDVAAFDTQSDEKLVVEEKERV